MSANQAAQQASNPATQQLQAAPPSTPISASAGSVDSLVCQWAGCGERAASAEQLYEHVCERHVGRKSTNNLNLTCQWGNCHTTTVKRDHITSHIRVHVPLKPHKCDFCGKSFKRPQDLKKHVKTHADESVIMRSPEPSSSSRHPSNGGPYGNMGNPSGNRGGYYGNPALQPSAMPMNYGAYQGHTGNGNGSGQQGGYYAPTAQATTPGYAPVYYGASNGTDLGNHAALEDRKRGLDVMNNLFGSIKRQDFDAHSYADVSHRLQPFHNMQLPIHAVGGVMSDYQQSLPPMIGTQAGAAVYGPTAASAHGFSIPNLRTKQDAVEAERMIEQMVHTAYESSHSQAVSGASQPGAVHIASGLTLRTSNSPPSAQLSRGHLMRNTSTSTNADTPELTPGSTVYSNGHSPTSVEFNTPTASQAPVNGQPMYPSLPNASSSMTGTAPTSTLGNQYDHENRRRYSGNLLQKSAPGPGSRVHGGSEDRSQDRMDIDSANGAQAPTLMGRTLSSKMIDPALSGDVPSSSESPTPPSSGLAAEVDQVWVDNLRLLEGLRDFVRAKLEHNDFEDEHPGQSLYPELRTV